MLKLIFNSAWSWCILNLALAFLSSCSPEVLSPLQTIQYSSGNGAVDIDGDSYTSVVYGNGQEWLAENLRTTHFANGDQILDVPVSSAWASLQATQDAQSSYNDDNQYDTPYGRYYNWSAVTDDRNVCPTGWHVPTLYDWQVLIDYFGGEEVSGHAMRLTGTQYWSGPNDEATNASGFSAVGAGERDGISGVFFNLPSFASWWSTHDTLISGQPFSNGTYGVSVLVGQTSNVSSDAASKKGGITVRCVKGTGPLPVFAANQFNNTSGSLAVDVINYDIAPILDGGICWSTSPNPTLGTSQSQHGIIGGGGITTGVFGEIWPAPVSGQTYYLRAYATNTFGTAYGFEETFTAP